MSSNAELSLEAKLAFLRQASSYPEPTYRVEAVETHMSWVFLTDRFAYKLKKPVRHEALDFCSIEARRFYCEEEIRLNRRLAPQVYLEAVPLSIDTHGHLQLAHDGRITDWLVKMRRLPADRMLDYVLKTGAGNADDMRRIASLLAGFYAGAVAGDVTADQYRSRLQAEMERNLSSLCMPTYQLPVERIRRVCAAQSGLLERQRGLFDERVRALRIVEGHGDLRPEHVCLNPELAIIDCLEFSLELRIVDAIDEVAFLALECERFGAAGLGAILLREYERQSGDLPDTTLVEFYQSYRACTRARIAILHLNEEKFRHSPEWRRRAMDYLHLAERRAGQFS